VEPFKLRFSISPDVIDQEVQLGETLLLDVKTLKYFGLTSVGTILWREMQKSQDLDEVFVQVASQSDLPKAELAAVVRAIIRGMEQTGLIRLEAC
jgi:hypothetical protein